MLATTAVIGHRVHRVPVEVGTANLPTRALSVRAQEECSFCRSHQQKKISLPDMNVSHTVQDGSSECAVIGTGLSGSDCSRLNRFQSCLHLTRALISLSGLFRQAALDDGPKAGRHGRAKRLGQLAHDRRADLKACASSKWQTARSRFIEHYSERPQITAVVGRLATQDFGSHIRQSAAYVGRCLHRFKRLRGALEQPAFYPSC